MPVFVRDPLTRVGYVMIAWFAYLQASPGLVVPHLRDELGIGYLVGGLHVAAFAAGAMLAGTCSSWLERILGRNRLVWSGAALLGAGAVCLTAGHTVEQTIAATLLMGIGGGLVLATVQATLADHHGALRTVALTEANVAASGAYLVLIGMFSLTAALHVGWRIAILASLLAPALVWWTHRGSTFDMAATSEQTEGRLPGAFWVAAMVLVCTTAAEWCVTAWGASFLEDVLHVSTDTAVSLMVGYFGGVLVGRVVGSRLARRYDPSRLLAWALAVAALGFVVMWPSVAPPQALVGLALLGVGLGNLFPLGMSLAVALAPTQAGLASGPSGGDDLARRTAGSPVGRKHRGCGVAEGRTRRGAGHARPRHGGVDARTTAGAPAPDSRRAPACGVTTRLSGSASSGSAQGGSASGSTLLGRRTSGVTVAA